VEGAILVGAAEMKEIFTSPLGRKVSGWTLDLAQAVGVDLGSMGRAVEQGQEVDLGLPEFPARFFVLATDEAEARRVLTPKAAEALRTFAPQTAAGKQRARALAAVWGPEGLTLLLGQALTSPEAMVSFAELGIALAGEVRSPSG
jgi:hypothetical protein